MSISTKKVLSRTDSADNKPCGSSNGGIARIRGLGKGIVALRRAVARNQTSVIRINGRRVAILPLDEYRRLERLLEQEEKEEEELDRRDLEEAERILNDPNEVSIPYEQVRRELGLGILSDRNQASGEKSIGRTAETSD